MKIIITTIKLIILSVNVYSQKGFYLHPLIENKSHVNVGYFSEVVTIKGDKFQVRPVNFYNDLNRIGFGLHAGYHTKKMFFEIGWVSDYSATTTRVVGKCMANDSTYFLDQVKNTISIPLNKFPIRVGTRVVGKDSVNPDKHVKWQCFLYAGVDLLRPSSNIKKQEFTHDFMIIPNQYARYENTYKAIFGNRAYSITLGTQLKAYNKKGRNIINLGIHYSLGTRLVLFNPVHLINYDGASYWTSGIRSKASGLYISISKDIYPKNLIEIAKLPTVF